MNTSNIEEQKIEKHEIEYENENNIIEEIIEQFEKLETRLNYFDIIIKEIQNKLFKLEQSNKEFKIPLIKKENILNKQPGLIKNIKKL